MNDPLTGEFYYWSIVLVADSRSDIRYLVKEMAEKMFLIIKFFLRISYDFFQMKCITILKCGSHSR